MAWKLLCDGCDAEIEDKNDQGETVFKTLIDHDGKTEAELTIRAEIGDDQAHFCMDCVRKLICE